jgi:hypothetical protein
MSEPWKCCSRCQCPCNNNDLCPDTASTLITQGIQNISQVSQRSKSSQSLAQSQQIPSPSLEELRALQQKVQERLRNLSLPKFREGIDESEESANSSSSKNSFVSDFHSDEILILRKRLQAAELRNAIIEEKVNQIYQKVISVEQILQLKSEIIDFIEEKFSRLVQNQR